MKLTYFPILVFHHFPSHLCPTHMRVLSVPRIYLTPSYHSNFATSIPYC